ncbi:conserved hypothetical protein [Reichenbachiella faecimaris]|uniref:Glycosyl transferase family 28 C-terminal domain-containing protein n=1 Tax=Reichenbachiella faecimaris TaxID=692418 RepID=A0A1W2G8G6_REIFA|nr:glycosyltransferase family protein [Reichenbachiella faecimaris]SMD32980.1 conserved hypothetical protein [Reichenbachiella faecimaris]
MSLIIAYYVHGRGRGHSSRALTVIKKLILRKYKLKLFAGRDAYPVLAERFEVRQVASIFPKSSLFDFIKRIIHDYNQLRSIKPDILISDGDAPSMWVAKWLGIPIFSIGHALIFPYCKHPISLSQWGLLKESLKVRVASQWADFRFILHFCPLNTKDSKSVLVKPDFEFDTSQFNRGNYLISYFRDGNGSPVLKSLVANGMTIRNFGQPVNINGIQNFPPDDMLFKQMLSGAMGIVSSSGSNIIFESMALQKPILLLYKATDFEQMANAKYVDHLGAGLSSTFDSITPELIQEFILSLENPPTRKNTFNVMPSLSDEIISHLKINFD